MFSEKNLIHRRNKNCRRDFCVLVFILFCISESLRCAHLFLSIICFSFILCQVTRAMHGFAQKHFLESFHSLRESFSGENFYVRTIKEKLEIILTTFIFLLFQRGQIFCVSKLTFYIKQPKNLVKFCL